MVKKRKKLPYAFKVLIAAVLYACVFATVVLFGLSKFWDWTAAYEKSRPQNTIDAYMDQLTVAHIQDRTSDLISTVDHNIQSEEQCRQKIADTLQNGIIYARKLSECTDSQLVYMLMSGGKTIGKVTLCAQQADEFGFTPWAVAAESFDFSFLIGTGTKITVPAHYSVYVNGTCLSENYIVESGMRFQLVKDFYSDYSLPTFVTYEVDPILGDLEVIITNSNGVPVTPEEALDEAAVLNNCSAEEIAQLDDLADSFIRTYVAYTTNANTDIQGNLTNLLSHIVLNGDLAERMKDAQNGLKWVGDQNATILSITTHHRIPFLDGYYLYDTTYEIETNYRGKVSTTTENIKLIIKPTENGLKVERMIGY